MPLHPRILRAELHCASDALAPLGRFYGQALGLPTRASAAGVSVDVGSAELAFVAAGGPARPFYHFALLVPGDRFDAAHVAVRARVPLLAGGDGKTVFAFAFWEARACYFHDPAGNIVELIAHTGVAERAATGVFAPAELAGISEVGLVTPTPVEVAAALADRLRLHLWFGATGAPDDLGFVGRRAHTLILARPGRPWLPTGRPAEPHPVDVTLTGARDGDVELGGGLFVRVRSAPART